MLSKWEAKVCDPIVGTSNVSTNKCGCWIGSRVDSFGPQLRTKNTVILTEMQTLKIQSEGFIESMFLLNE